MKARILIAAAVAFGLTAPAFAATSAKAGNTTANCFLSQNWQDWHAPNDKTIYLRVNAHDFWQIDLASGSNMVTDPSNHLVNDLRGSSWICHPVDLDLKISDGHFSVPLFVKGLTKLSPEQVAAIPKKDLP